MATRPGAWLAGGAEIAIGNLPTWYGRLSYSLARVADDSVRFSLSGELEAPPGGIVLRSPLLRPLARVSVDGRNAVDFEATSVRLERLAANVVLHY